MCGSRFRRVAAFSACKKGESMGYQAPTWVNNGAPSLSAENMQQISNWLEYCSNNMVNPNLLDNWYFGNPVNQRGKTSYTGGGYCIDRWKLQNDTNLTVGSGFCTLHGSWDMRQIFESLPQATYTVSVLFKNSTANALQILFGTKTGADVSVAISHDASGLLVGTGNNIDLPSVIISLSGSGSVDLIAVKLELGSVQTLAHQENGVWVLNEIPDYGEQLRRCQRYLRPAGYSFVVSNASGNWYGSGLFGNSEPMRAVPVIVNGDYKAQPVREATGGQCATIDNVFTPNIYGQFTVQLSPLGSTIPNYVYIDPTEFNPLLSAEL